MRAPHLLQDRPTRCTKCRIAPPSARGMCVPCYSRCAAHGRLADHERRLRSRDEVLDDWQMLCAEGYTKPQIAARLEMSLAALERAVNRARSVGDARAVPAVRSRYLRYNQPGFERERELEGVA